MYDYESCTEAVLVKRAKKKDAKAFSKLYESVYLDLYRFALCTMHHKQDAEDAVSETVIAAYENLTKLRKEEAFRSWIFKILANICKKKWKKTEWEEPFLETDDVMTEVDMELAQDVRNAFTAITEEEQIVVALSVFGGYNSKEIGTMLELNANTVRSKRSRALGKMGCILK